MEPKTMLRGVYVLLAGLMCVQPSLARGEDWVPAKSKRTIRIATYNVSLNRTSAGDLAVDLRDGNSQAEAVAAVIRAVQPDVLLLNEVDYDPSGDNASLFASQYLSEEGTDDLGGSPWRLPYVYSAEVNTGVPSGMDLNRNGNKNDAEDAWGYGQFPGQYGMAVLSRFEMDRNAIRTFQKFRWSSMPDAMRPTMEDGSSYYPQDVWEKLRLSSKSFWDVPVKVTVSGKAKTIHILASHPTPPAFDGPEDRNGCRNHDEIRMVVDYISGRDYLVDDGGDSGGLDSDASFVVLGDLNSDPFDGGSQAAAIRNLLQHERVSQSSAPASVGAKLAADMQGRANEQHRGPADQDTGDFSDRSVGNLRIDYALPSVDWRIVQCGVFWPAMSEVPERYQQAMKQCLDASDHHLVWIDLQATTDSDL